MRLPDRLPFRWNLVSECLFSIEREPIFNDRCSCPPDAFHAHAELPMSQRVWAAWLGASLALGCVNRSTANGVGAASSSASPANEVAARSSSATPAAAQPVTPASSADRNESQCAACNGEWKIHGLSRAPSCNCRTSDGGKLCRDGAECQGQCVAEERAEQEIIDPGPPARGRFVGRCSEFATVFGCRRFIPRGVNSAGAVNLSVPPPKICFD